MSEGVHSELLIVEAEKIERGIALYMPTFLKYNDRGSFSPLFRIRYVGTFENLEKVSKTLNETWVVSSMNMWLIKTNIDILLDTIEKEYEKVGSIGRFKPVRKLAIDLSLISSYLQNTMENIDVRMFESLYKLEELMRDIIQKEGGRRNFELLKILNNPPDNYKINLKKLDGVGINVSGRNGGYFVLDVAPRRGNIFFLEDRINLDSVFSENDKHANYFIKPNPTLFSNFDPTTIDEPITYSALLSMIAKGGNDKFVLSSLKDVTQIANIDENKKIISKRKISNTVNILIKGHPIKYIGKIVNNGRTFYVFKVFDTMIEHNRYIYDKFSKILEHDRKTKHLDEYFTGVVTDDIDTVIKNLDVDVVVVASKSISNENNHVNGDTVVYFKDRDGYMYLPKLLYHQKTIRNINIKIVTRAKIYNNGELIKYCKRRFTLYPFKPEVFQVFTNRRLDELKEKLKNRYVDLKLVAERSAIYNGKIINIYREEIPVNITL